MNPSIPIQQQQEILSNGMPQINSTAIIGVPKGLRQDIGTRFMRSWMMEQHRVSLWGYGSGGEYECELLKLIFFL